MTFDFARSEHHLLAVTDFNAFLLQREQHSRLAYIETERHVGHAFLLEDVLDLLRCLFEQADLGPNGAAHSRIAGAHVVLVQPWAIDPVMARSGTEIPNPRVAGSGEQGISNQFVASPLADDGTGDVA